MSVGEFDPVRIVRVAGDAEVAPVVNAMMFGAQRDQIVGVGGPVVGPVHDVMHVEPAMIVATWHPAPAVAMDHGPSSAFGDDPLGASDRNRRAVDFEDLGPQPIAGHVVGDVSVDAVPAGVGRDT